MDWLEDFIRTYLERDVPQMGFRVPADRLRRLWTMLAHSQGQLVNYSQFGSGLEIDGKTARHYLDLLVSLLLVRRSEPWHANIKKRLIKSPRYYIRDSGVQHCLLGINNHDVLPSRARTYFYRTVAGAEIDLVIQLSPAELWAVEIKYGLAPKVSKHHKQACEEIGATSWYVVYGGDDEFPIGNGVVVISLAKFLQKLEGISL